MRWLVLGCLGAAGVGCAASGGDKVSTSEGGLEGDGSDSGGPPGDSGESSDSGESGDSGEPAPRTLDWVDCTTLLELDADAPALDEDTHCASISVPFRHFSTGTDPDDDTPEDDDPEDDDPDDADPDDETWAEPEQLGLVVIELPALAPPQGTFWLLDGGPGGTGVLPARSSALVQELREGGFAVRIPVHRGSTELAHRSCNGRSLVACGKSLVERYGDGLTGFGPMEAAADVLAWLDADDREGRDLLWGQSYGSLVAQLVLAQRPGAVHGVVLDGVLPLDAEVEQVNILADAPFQAFVESCGDAARCVARTGTDPLGFAQRAVAAGCGPLRGVAQGEVEALVRGFAGSAYAPVTLPMLAMMERCETADSEALSAMITFVTANLPRGDELNPALQAHVLLGELFHPTLAADELVAREDATLFPGNSSERFYSAAEAWEGMDGVPFPESLGAWEAPVLVFQGGRDLQTPALWSERVVDRLDAPRVTTVALPSVGHLALAGASTADERACVSGMLLRFGEAPAAAVDQDCVAELPPVDHDISTAEAQALSLEVFGVDDPWSL
jgi:pimeloyl-ACP methyl ester carboxylesterase